MTLKPLTIKALLSDAPSGAAIPPGKIPGWAGDQATGGSEQDKSWLLPQVVEDTKWPEPEEADKPRLLGGGWVKNKIVRAEDGGSGKAGGFGAQQQRPTASSLSS